MDCWRIVAVFFCIFMTLHCVTSKEEKVNENFDVKPGGVQHKHEKQLGHMKCTFVYVAQGGTNENWEMELTKNENDIYDCTVVRPQGISYLFFQHFKMKLRGVKLTTAEAMGNNGVPLDNEEFTIDPKHNEVRSSKDHFKSQLSGLTAYASEKRSEL